MRINKVTAGAFGPFRAQSLDIAPGMTVVHGPNEAGKSSWFAAIYGGLAGRRRQRGRGTVAQAEFARRHQPWSGSQWVVGVTITLDDGRTLAIENDLRRGESRIVDGATGRGITVAELERRLGMTLTTESTLDGTRLLGLNRDNARATIFAGQADVLRVLEDAGELQEFLERAASSEAVDATADGALSWLGERRSALVGSESVGNRPLRASRLALRAASAETTERRDQLVRLYQVIGDRQQLGGRLEQAKADVEAVERQAKWQKVRELQGRVARAEKLAAELAGASSAARVDEDQVRRGAGILSVYDAAREVSPLPEGLSAAAIEAEVNALPERPDGDLEPRHEIVSQWQALTQAQTALSTHLETSPEKPVELPDVSISPDEIRSLASTLEVPRPAVDPSLVDELQSLRAAEAAAIGAYEGARRDYEAATRRNDDLLREHAEAIEQYKLAFSAYERARSEREARLRDALRAREQQQASRGKARHILAGVGLALLVAGIVLLALGQIPAGVAVAIAGLGLASVGLVPLRAAATVGAETGADDDLGSPPQQPTPPRLESVQAPPAPTPNPRVMELQVLIQAQENTVQAHADRLAAARATLASSGLNADPVALRQLARSIDDSAAATERYLAHSRQTSGFGALRELRAKELGDLLGVSIDADISDETVRTLGRVYQTYEEECQQRAAIAKQADRRADLQAALVQRRRVEEGHATAVSERQAQVAAVMSFVAGLGEAPEGPDQAAGMLRGWLSEREQVRIAQGHREQLGARLDQVLDGKDLPGLKVELEDLVASAGPEPDTIPQDLDLAKAQAKQLHDALLDRSGQLLGQQRQITGALGSVAASLEREAEAERATKRVETLASCIDTAATQLTIAKERANANIAPAIQSRVRPWLSKVTNGRYLDVSVDPSDLTMKVSEANGAVRDARLLSHGTTEQLFLLLRVALAQTLSGGSETAPMILDDVTVQSDLERTVAILEMLHQLSEEHQVILFSQEDEVAKWARDNLRGERDKVISLPGPR